MSRILNEKQKKKMSDPNVSGCVQNKRTYTTSPTLLIRSGVSIVPDRSFKTRAYLFSSRGLPGSLSVFTGLSSQLKVPAVNQTYMVITLYYHCSQKILRR